MRKYEFYGGETWRKNGLGVVTTMITMTVGATADATAMMTMTTDGAIGPLTAMATDLIKIGFGPRPSAMGCSAAHYPVRLALAAVR